MFEEYKEVECGWSRKSFIWIVSWKIMEDEIEKQYLVFKGVDR